MDKSAARLGERGLPPVAREKPVSFEGGATPSFRIRMSDFTGRDRYLSWRHGMRAITPAILAAGDDSKQCIDEVNFDGDADARTTNSGVGPGPTSLPEPGAGGAAAR